MSLFGETLASWDAFNTNLKNRLEELPALAPGQQELEQAIAAGQSLAAQRDKQIADLRENTVARRLLVKNGNRLREFLAMTLAKELGFESQRLHEFNIRPRNERRKKKLPGEPPPGPASPKANA